MNRQLIEDYTAGAEALPSEARAVEVLCWRLEQLERAGYSSELAYAIAENHEVDLHRACDLLRRGCPEHTAYLILS
ncbi:MAG TPA: hypothetical protein VFB42_02565 [Gaiellaceae bacterium]|nr:hypothetical protein [Gaiellaceae bacterium]